MPRFKVTVEARKRADVDQTIEVEAKDAKDAKAQVQQMIKTDQIRNSRYELVGGEYYSDVQVGDVEKLS